MPTNDPLGPRGAAVLSDAWSDVRFAIRSLEEAGLLVRAAAQHLREQHPGVDVKLLLAEADEARRRAETLRAIVNLPELIAARQLTGVQ